ncbi:MAG: hypothetical protein HUK28_04190 [Methanobrevibacter sp.]|nr:hypothetical protein [Methanobrevibacter sp.]
MDNKGFISIQYLFSIFILILIASCILFVAAYYISSTENIEKHSTIRIVLDEICDDVNQVNSNGENYSKQIQLPSTIKGDKYSLKVSKNKIVFSGGGRMAENYIIPINLVKKDIKIDNIELYGGNSYLIKKHGKSQVSITQIG